MTHWLRDGRYAWRMLWRDWRSGELRILALALVIAVSSVTAVAFFVDRVQRGLDQQAGELLAADLVVRSKQPLVAEMLAAARRLQLTVATTTSFRSMVMAGGQPQLVEVKAVSAAYPLRGTLRIAASAFAAGQAVASGPERGELWAEPRILRSLSLVLGDSLTLGRAQMKLSQVLVFEPDRGGDMFSIAPRLLMHAEDVAATELIQHGALVEYRLLLAGQRSDIQAYQDWFGRQSFVAATLMTAADGRPELRAALMRAERFLGLAALISVLLAGVAIAMAARRFSQRHLDSSAILRCLGATQARIIRLYLLEMLMLALLASSVAGLIAYMAQFVISQLLDRMLLVQLPAAGWQALGVGYATGIILLLGFALPPLLALKHVPPLRVLRRDIGLPVVHAGWVYASAVAGMTALMVWQVGELSLVLWLLLGLFVTLLLLALCAYGMVLGLGCLRHRVGVAWRFGLANIARRRAESVVQVVALGIGIMVLLLLAIVRTDLLDGWSDSLPADTPNHFLINVQTEQVDAMQQFLREHGVTTAQLYPMVRARLQRINDQEVKRERYDGDSRAQHLATRAFNLSWAGEMQADNRLVAGRWWTADEHGQRLISLEEGMAKALGIKLNDLMSFDIDGELQEFRVSSIRTVEWDSFNINFFTVVPPGVLADHSASWVTSVYLSPQQKQHLAPLVKAFPNVTVIDVETIISRVRQVIDRVTLAVEFIFFFTLLAGLVVLFAAIQSNQDERRYENAILRVLGAQRKTLLYGLITEFVMLGAVAGLLAGVTATALAYVLAVQVFHFSYQFNPAIILIGLIAGIVIVGLAGVLGTRSVLNQAPLVTLREG